MTLELGLLALAGFFAGFVDAVAGGGGLVQLPALFAAYPGAHAATLFGTNKAASVWGTAVAARQYGQSVCVVMLHRLARRRMIAVQSAPLRRQATC